MDNLPEKREKEFSLLPLEKIKDKDLLQLIDLRLLQTTDVEEVKSLVKVREDILKQNETIEQNKQDRYQERFNMYLYLVSAIAFIVIGISLIMLKYNLVGFFILGAGLYIIVPNYVTTFLTRNKKKTDEE